MCSGVICGLSSSQKLGEESFGRNDDRAVDLKTISLLIGQVQNHLESVNCLRLGLEIRE
jgi:hypothetical protein